MSRSANGYPSAAMPGSAMNSSSRLATPQLTSRPRSPAGPAMSRAERFEDEKRRIIESCFSKLDQNGQLAESYITHIRITEDAQYPSFPPPPDSAADNKKPRLIIIAVRSTGRVRMHKARENTNGSFSIGKTWNMEELSAIETYSSATIQPQNDRESQFKSWAGTTGFTVTVTKPYYWQAGTSKEKDFFIASTVKIYRKYTKGQVPELKGFDERDRVMMLGGAQPEQQNQPPPQPASRAPGDHRDAPGAPPPPPFAQREQSREESRYRQSPGPPPGSGPSSRLPSESPARFGMPQAPNPPFAGPPAHQQRSPSRDGARMDLRPGAIRAPSHALSARGDQQMPRSPMRAETPGRSPGPPAAASREHLPAPLKPAGPPRPKDVPASIDGVSSESYEDRFMPTSNSDADRGAQLFQSTRQAWMNYQADQPRVVSPPPQLPPIETVTSTQPRPSGPESATSQLPATATPESSAGVDLGDAAAIAALTSYWGPEPQASEPSAVQVKEPSSLPTPEKSRRRPQIESLPTESSIDLRPAPLNQSRRPPAPEVQPVAQQESRSQPAPEPEKPIEVKPLHVQNKSETVLSVPGAFTPKLMQLSPDASPAGTPVEEKTEEEFRPGLGPMIKKRAVANRFKKAANAANAFKPRPGGAAEKILKAKAEREGEPDGITGVVPRPQARQDPSQESIADSREDLAVKIPGKDQRPALEVTSPRSPLQPGTIPSAINGDRGVEPVEETAQVQQSPEQKHVEIEDQVEHRPVRQPQVRIKRRSMQQEKYLAALEIDRSLLEGRGLEFEMMLSDFGWSKSILQTKQLAELEADLRREHGRVEAGSWLSHTDAAREERVAQVESLLDKTIAECDELEGLLTLYHVELSSLHDDIAFIEAQSQGLQVQSANQKLLQSELQGLIDTMSLDRRALEPLRYGDLSTAHSLDDVEQSLVRLYQAMLTMDPSMRSTASTRPRSQAGIGDSHTSSMVALREKKTVYDRESAEFCQRLMQFLDGRFATSMNSAKGRVVSATGGLGLARLHPEVFDEVRSGLWMYSPLLLFAKELHMPAWQTMLRMYHQRAMPVYSDAFKENVTNWKRAARTTSGDDTDILFTAQEREETPASALSSARKLTVKRSQTLAKTLRNASGDKHYPSEPRQAGAVLRSVAFAGAMDEMAPLISREQNFIVDLFHASSLEAADFVDAVNAAAPGARRGTNLLDRKPTEPDRGMAGRVVGAMGELFSFFLTELSSMLDWAVSDDPLQGVGIMASLGRHAFFLQDSSQEFLLKVVESLSSRLQTRFNKFVEEQIRAIEDTKVKIKKRKGVIAFMKIFPHFSAAVENIFSAVAGNDYDGPSECIAEVRRIIDDAYDRINRAMFDSLKVIAKESPVAGVAPNQQLRAGDDPEDKEMLNYHILLIENMNHYIEEVDDGGREGVLAEWKGRAMLERVEALDAYVARVIRRPLGKLLDFLESADTIASSHPGNPAAISSRPSYSRKAMRTVLAQHDSKEVRRGIDTLRKRIEKHFGDGDEEAISRSLVGYVCKECERSYERVLERTERLVRDVYPPMEGEKSVEVDFGKADIQAGFRR